MSASSFLGFAGLIFLFGVDAFVGLMAAIVAFVPVLLFLAERMRNSGKFTLADVLSFRLRERPARLVAAIGTLSVVIIYLLAQMVGAGALIQALTGITFTPAVIIVGGFMLTYVIFGGMLATTWVQIIKATLLMTAGIAADVPGAARRSASTRSSCSARRATRTRRARRTSSRACSSTPASRCSRSGSRSCSAPPGCRTSSCASSPCRTPRRRAARSAGPCS